MQASEARAGMRVRVTRGEVIEQMRAEIERLRRENTALRAGLSEIVGLVCCESPGDSSWHTLSGWWLLNVKDIVETAFQLAEEVHRG